MKTKTIGATLALVVALTMFAASSASAATTVGNPCLANKEAKGATIIGTANDPSVGLPATIPANGVITSWSTNIPSTISPGVYREKIKVFQPNGAVLQVVGESPLEPIVGGTNTFKARISVKAGDLIGSTGVATLGSESILDALYCEKAAAGNRIGAVLGDPAVGTSTALAEEAGGYAQPITVQVEPDADGDGYGDETQDLCPTNAAVQGPCPAPPAPITLSATSAAKKGSVAVTLTASAQASVTVAGTVKVGGSKMKLSGGTQTVTPGTLAKFTVLFPAKLKKQLKKTPTNKKLTLELSASAPGATTSAFKVKVKGQMKKPKHDN